MYDINTNSIAKGISSVKYMNSNVANELYYISQNKPDTFMELLIKLEDETSLDTRQRDILIKIDYFSEYGNSRELLRLVDFYNLFTSRNKIAKNKLPKDLEDIVSLYSSDLLKSGKHGKSWVFNDFNAILNEIEAKLKSYQIPDLSFKDKIQNQQENLGYVDLTTGNKEDRRKLIVLDVYPLQSNDKNVWGYAINTKSLGSGKEARLTIKSSLYNKQPIKKYDVIYASNVYKNNKGYWYLDSYCNIV